MILIPTPPPEPVINNLSMVVNDSPLAHGEAGQFMQEALREMNNHWDSIAVIFDKELDDSEIGEVIFDSPPPKRRFTVSTKYIFKGRAKPIDFEIEED